MATTTIFFLLVYDFVYEKFRWIIFYLSLSFLKFSSYPVFFWTSSRVCDVRSLWAINSIERANEATLPPNFLAFCHGN